MRSSISSTGNYNLVITKQDLQHLIDKRFLCVMTSRIPCQLDKHYPGFKGKYFDGLGYFLYDPQKELNGEGQFEPHGLWCIDIIVEGDNDD